MPAVEGGGAAAAAAAAGAAATASVELKVGGRGGRKAAVKKKSGDVAMPGKRATVTVTAPLLPALQYAVARQVKVVRGSGESGGGGRRGQGTSSTALPITAAAVAGGFLVAALPLPDDFAKLALAQVLLDRGVIRLVPVPPEPIATDSESQSPPTQVTSVGSVVPTSGGVKALDTLVARCDRATSPVTRAWKDSHVDGKEL